MNTASPGRASSGSGQSSDSVLMEGVHKLRPPYIALGTLVLGPNPEALTPDREAIVNLGENCQPNRGRSNPPS